MKLKSYHADSVESAIRLARIELGDEAVFLGSRQVEEAEPEGRRYEVTFAVPGAGSAATAAPQPALGAEGSEGPPAWPGDESDTDPGSTSESAGADETPASKAAAWKRWLFPSVAAAETEKGERSRSLSTAAGGARSAGPPQAVGESGREASPGWGGDAVRPPSAQRQAGAKRPRETSKPRHWKDFVPEAFAEPGVAEAVLSELPPTAHKASAERSRTPPAGKAAAVPAATPDSAPQGRSSEPAPKPSATLADVVDRMVAELQELRRAVERQASPQWPCFLPSGRLLADARLSEIYAGLVSSGVEPRLAAQLVAGLESAAAQGNDRKGLRMRLQGQLRELCQVANQLGRPGSQPRMVALVGPSGVGKTTTVAKLAIRYGLVQQHRVHLMGIDLQRVGAAEPLEAYAELLGTPLTIVDHWEDLPAALESAAHPNRADQAELVLIDTPGYGPAEWSRARRLAEQLSANGGIEVHLVLSVAAKAADLSRAVDRYQIFGPAKLIFTRLDETDSHGALLNEMVRTRLPLSFLTAGQRVPEDILPASEAYLTRLLLKKDLVS